MKKKIKRKISANVLLKYLGKEIGIDSHVPGYIDKAALRLNSEGFKVAGEFLKDGQIIYLGKKCNLPFVLNLTGFDPKELCKKIITTLRGYLEVDNYILRRLV